MNSAAKNKKSGQVPLLPTPERRRLMAKVRRSGTSPELAVRSMLHRAGYRYRVSGGKALPGTPDIVLPRLRLAIFVDGCFWHGCPKHGTVPKTNTEFWTSKIERNRDRDRAVRKSLNGLGWKVLRVWEHELKSGGADLIKRVARYAALSCPEPSE